MKKLTTIILALTVAAVCGYSQNVDNPGAYMTALDQAHEDMDQKYMAYVSASAHGKRARKVEKLRKQVLEAITQSKYKTSDLPFYKGDNSLRQSNLEYIQLCYNIFNEDYAKIVNMEDIAEQSFDEMEAYLLLREKTDEKLREAAQKLGAEEKKFAAKYNVNVVEVSSALGEKMKITGQVNRYYNKVYLVFFKTNWQSNLITRALNEGKVNDVEQARSAVLKYSAEGLAILDTMKGFNMDKSLIFACRQALQLYKKRAENDVPKMTDFLVKKENFEKIKKATEAKSTRTKEDVDEFNKAVKDFNAAVEVYNKANNNSNAATNEAHNAWESAVNTFFDTHIPKHR